MPRFGLITDLHYADREAANNRYYRESRDKLTECVQLMNQEKVDFLLELGDLKDESVPPEEATTLDFLRQVEETFKAFEGPRHYVLGNHDFDQISKAQFMSVTGAQSPHYSFDVKGIHFVVLDACFNSDGEDYDHGNFRWSDANIPQEQLQWLGADLAKTRTPVIVFVHQLLDGVGQHYVKNAEAARSVLEDSGKVLAVFQGHKHDGGHQVINGIHYYTLLTVIWP
jgi:predicted phosphodiesterase